jgi:hypothetical protein
MILLIEVKADSEEFNGYNLSRNSLYLNKDITLLKCRKQKLIFYEVFKNTETLYRFRKNFCVLYY